MTATIENLETKLGDYEHECDLLSDQLEKRVAEFVRESVNFSQAKSQIQALQSKLDKTNADLEHASFALVQTVSQSEEQRASLQSQLQKAAEDASQAASDYETRLVDIARNSEERIAVLVKRAEDAESDLVVQRDNYAQLEEDFFEISHKYEESSVACAEFREQLIEKNASTEKLSTYEEKIR